MYDTTQTRKEQEPPKWSNERRLSSLLRSQVTTQPWTFEGNSDQQRNREVDSELQNVE